MILCALFYPVLNLNKLKYICKKVEKERVEPKDIFEEEIDNPKNGVDETQNKIEITTEKQVEEDEEGFFIETFFIGPLLGALLCLACQTIPFTTAMKGLWSFSSLNPIGIVILFFSMVYISKYLDSTGFFEFCALYAVQKARGNGKMLFFIIYAIVSFLSILTSNDIVILTFTPFIYHFTKSINVDPIPFLFGEFFGSNTWSMFFIFGNPTNVVLASGFGVTFTDFAKNMALTTFFAGVSNCLLLYFYFRKRINKPFSEPEAKEPNSAIKSMQDMIIGVIFCVVAIVLMAISSAPSFPLEMWHASAVMAGVLIIYNISTDCYRKTKVLWEVIESMPWSILPFLPSLFILVNSLHYNNVLIEIGELFIPITYSKPLTFFIFGFVSTLITNILNNIPMSVSFVPIIKAASTPFSEAALYSTIMGSNLGANLTPIGALAGIMWLKLLKDYKIELGFLQFLKVGIVITPITVLMSFVGWSVVFGY